MSSVFPKRSLIEWAVLCLVSAETLPLSLVSHSGFLPPPSPFLENEKGEGERKPKISDVAAMPKPVPGGLGGCKRHRVGGGDAGTLQRSQRPLDLAFFPPLSLAVAPTQATLCAPVFPEILAILGSPF